MQYEKYFLSLLYFATYFTSFWASGIIVKFRSKEENIHHSTRHSVTTIVKYFLIFLTDAKTGSTNPIYINKYWAVSYFHTSIRIFSTLFICFLYLICFWMFYIHPRFWFFQTFHYFWKHVIRGHTFMKSTKMTKCVTLPTPPSAKINKINNKFII